MDSLFIVELWDTTDNIRYKTICHGENELSNLLLNIDKQYKVIDIITIVDHKKSDMFLNKNTGLETGI